MGTNGIGINEGQPLTKVEQAMLRHGLSPDTMGPRVEAYNNSAAMHGVDPNTLPDPEFDTSTSLFARQNDVFGTGPNGRNQYYSNGTTPAYRDAISKINIDPDVRSVMEANDSFTLHTGEVNPNLYMNEGEGHFGSLHGVALFGKDVYVPEYYADPQSGMNPGQFPTPTMKTALAGGWRRHDPADVEGIGNHEFSHVEDCFGRELGQKKFSESPSFRAAVERDMQMHKDPAALHKDFEHFVGEDGTPVHSEIFAESGAVAKGHNAYRGFEETFPNAIEWSKSFGNKLKEGCRDAVQNGPEGFERLKEWAKQTCTSNDLPEYSPNSNLNEDPTQGTTDNDPPPNAGSDEQAPGSSTENSQAQQEKAPEAMAGENSSSADMDLPSTDMGGYKSERPGSLPGMKADQAKSLSTDPFGSGSNDGLGNLGSGRGDYNSLKALPAESLGSSANGLEPLSPSGLGAMPSAAPAAAPAVAPVAAPAIAPAAMPMVPF